MVSLSCEIFLLCLVTTVLTFFIAGLLFICALSTSITWERTASRPETGLLIPSGYVSYDENSACCFIRHPISFCYHADREAYSSQLRVRDRFFADSAFGPIGTRGDKKCVRRWSSD